MGVRVSLISAHPLRGIQETSCLSTVVPPLQTRGGSTDKSMPDDPSPNGYKTARGGFLNVLLLYQQKVRPISLRIAEQRRDHS